jgi:DNA polymerase-1
MIDLKALMGDSSDNIPGVPGVGEKTAMDLIQKYQSIETIYAQLPDIEAKPAAVRKLTEGEESARHSYWLATIATDAPLDFVPENNLKKAPAEEAYSLFLKLEFTKLIEKFGLQAATDTTTKEKHETTAVIEQIATEEQAESMFALWHKADHVSLLALPDLTGISVVCEAEENSVLTAELFFEKYQGNWNELLKKVFSAEIRKVSHNVKDLMRTLLANHLPADGFVFDTALGAYLLDATAGGYDLERLFVSYYNTELPKPLYLETDAFSLLGDTAQAEASFNSHAAAVEALYQSISKKLRQQGMWELFEKVEMPLCRVLA